MSLDAIIGPYLQGQWPKEPEGQSPLSHVDKSTQVSCCQTSHLWRKWMECILSFISDTSMLRVLTVMRLFGGGLSLLKLRSTFAVFAVEEVAWKWGVGLTSSCTVIAQWEPQLYEQSADEANLVAPILSALSVQGLATVLTLPTSFPRYFVFRFLLLISRSFQVWKEILWVWMVRCGCTPPSEHGKQC